MTQMPSLIESGSKREARIQAAIIDLQSLIKTDFPHATFEVSLGDDPEGIYLTVVVDVADTDTVVDLFINRLIELQMDEDLPLYVIPLRPPERSAALR